MKSLLDCYLDRVLVYANRPEAEADTIRRELCDHLLQKIDDLAASGVPREEAVLEALRQHGSPKTIGYKLRPSFPWIDIRSRGTARGVIAIGPKAVGIFALGGYACGVVAFGGFAVGVFGFGGFALGLLFAFAGFGAGGIVMGGFALGIVAAGGYVFGVVGEGGQGLALWVPHGHAISHYTARDVPAVLRMLEHGLILPEILDRCFVVFFPIYCLVMFLMMWLQQRETKRIESTDDWLIDG